MEKYNGWANYATWRVNLEFFDGIDWNNETDGFYNTQDCAAHLQEMVCGFVEDMEITGASSSSVIFKGWAFAFVQEADFDEIAEHIMADYPHLQRKND